MFAFCDISLLCVSVCCLIEYCAAVAVPATAVVVVVVVVVAV